MSGMMIPHRSESHAQEATTTHTTPRMKSGMTVHIATNDAVQDPEDGVIIIIIMSRNRRRPQTLMWSEKCKDWQT